jgi:hypothetical protein
MRTRGAGACSVPGFAHCSPSRATTAGTVPPTQDDLHATDVIPERFIPRRRRLDSVCSRCPAAWMCVRTPSRRHGRPGPQVLVVHGVRRVRPERDGHPALGPAGPLLGEGDAGVHHLRAALFRPVRPRRPYVRDDVVLHHGVPRGQHVVLAHDRDTRHVTAAHQEAVRLAHPRALRAARGCGCAASCALAKTAGTAPGWRSVPGGPGRRGRGSGGRRARSRWPGSGRSCRRPRPGSRRGRWP